MQIVMLLREAEGGLRYLCLHPSNDLVYQINYTTCREWSGACLRKAEMKHIFLFLPRAPPLVFLFSFLFLIYDGY